MNFGPALHLLQVEDNEAGGKAAGLIDAVLDDVEQSFDPEKAAGPTER